MALPEGASYVPGTDRSFARLGSGEVVKRQTAENMYASSLGVPGVSNEYQRKKLMSFRKTEQGRSALESNNTAKGREANKALKEAGDPRARSDKSFDALALALARDHAEHGSDMDRSPDGPLAQYLVAIGRRNLGADYSVGETPGT